MLNIRKSEDRGNADHGWLKSRHTFSFADYHDPKFMGFRSLRVINEDRIDGGTGFGKHGHRDMEIISYVVDGALAHKDSMGNEAIILPGEVQRLTAGTGITHSEHNYKPKDVTHFFQIWIVPKKNGVQPGYGQKSFEKDFNSKNLVLVVSEDGRDGSIKINQDADVYISRLKENEKLSFSLRPNRGAWVQVVRGEIKVNEKVVKAGDALAIEDLALIDFNAKQNSELILFDLV